MPNLVICLTILRFVLFGPRDPPTTSKRTRDVNPNLDIKKYLIFFSQTLAPFQMIRPVGISKTAN